MELKTKLFAILAIFCVLCSACAVCAADDVDAMSADDGIFIDGSSHDGHDGAIIPPDNSHDEARHAAGMDPYLDGSEDGHNGTIIPPDAAHNEAAMDNVTNSTPAAGGDVSNSTGNSTGINGVNSILPATGNPLVILLGCLAVVGGISVLRNR